MARGTIFIRCCSVAAALLLFCSLGFAQSAPIPAAPAQSSPSQPAPAQSAPARSSPAPADAPRLTRDGKPRAKEVRAGCRDEAKAKGLTGRDQAFRDHMRDCIGKQRPDLVKAYECRQEARQKKIEKTEIRAYIKACRAKA